MTMRILEKVLMQMVKKGSSYQRLGDNLFLSMLMGKLPKVSASIAVR